MLLKIVTFMKTTVEPGVAAAALAYSHRVKISAFIIWIGFRFLVAAQIFLLLPPFSLRMASHL